MVDCCISHFVMCVMTQQKESTANDMAYLPVQATFWPSAPEFGLLSKWMFCRFIP